MEGLRIEEKDNALYVSLSGEVTLESTAALKQEIEAALDESGAENVVVDLAGVSFMDSSGIGFLVALNTRVKGRNRNMYLFRPSSQVAKTLELVQLSSFFRILDDQQDLLRILPE
jgi:anti-sigma B factor antagonist